MHELIIKTNLKQSLIFLAFLTTILINKLILKINRTVIAHQFETAIITAINLTPLLFIYYLLNLTKNIWSLANFV
jgi:hypothetical protein